MNGGGFNGGGGGGGSGEGQVQSFGTEAQGQGQAASDRQPVTEAYSDAKGRDFKHEKTKQKRASGVAAGYIDSGEVRSTPFEDE